MFQRFNKTGGCTGKNLVFLPGQHRPRLKAGCKRYKTKAVILHVKMEAECRPNTVFYHIGSVEQQVKGCRHLHFLVIITKPIRQYIFYILAACMIRGVPFRSAGVTASRRASGESSLTSSSQCSFFGIRINSYRPMSTGSIKRPRSRSLSPSSL